MAVLQRPYPGGARFAFTIFDDTDVATVENIRPVYRLIEALGMRTTKTVWPLPCPEGSRDFGESQTLADSEYLDFVLDLQARGFEIASHGATMESSPRARTLKGLDRLREVFGAVPRLHANHAYNRENVYWGVGRIDATLLSMVYGSFNGRPRDHYQGDREGSPFWWGDRCQEHFAYVRNLSFDEVNLLTINPSMPYHDPRRPLVRAWFSASDAEDAEEFVHLLRPEALDRLEQQGGVCIVATHLGKGFVADGKVHAGARETLEAVAYRPGWFPTTGELLDWLAARRPNPALPGPEWQRMQWRWFRELVLRRWRVRQRRASSRR